jgi:hypothetical protein
MKRHITYALSLLFLLNTASFAGKRIERDEVQFDDEVTMKRDLTVADAIDNSAGKIIANGIENKDNSNPIIVKPNNGVLTGDFDLMTFKSGGNKQNLVGLNKIKTDNIQATDGETQITIGNNIIVNGTSEFNGNMDLQNFTISDVGLLGTVNIIVTGISELRGDINNTLGAVVVDDPEGLVVDQGTLDVHGNIQNTTGNLIIDDTTDFNNNNVLNINNLGSFVDNVTLGWFATINMGAGGDILFPSGGNVGSVGNRVSNIYVTTLDATTIAGTPTFSGTPSFGNITVTGTSDLQGNISDSSGNLILGDNVDVTGILDAQATIIDSTGDLTLDDAVVITGTSDLQGNISDSSGNLALSDNVDVTGVLDAQATIIDSTGALTLDDAVVVTGTLDAQGAINLSTVPAYADDATAGVAGLVTGDVYKTDGTGAAPLNVAGILMIKQ